MPTPALVVMTVPPACEEHLSSGEVEQHLLRCLISSHHRTDWYSYGYPGSKPYMRAQSQRDTCLWRAYGSMSSQSAVLRLLSPPGSPLRRAAGVTIRSGRRGECAPLARLRLPFRRVGLARTAQSFLQAR